MSLGVFAVGEALLAPSHPALVNDLAPGGLRGRYNAVFTLSWQIGAVIAPALAGAMLGHGYGGPFILVTAGGCAAGAGLAIGLGRVVPTDADRPTFQGGTLEGYQTDD